MSLGPCLPSTCSGLIPSIMFGYILHLLGCHYTLHLLSFVSHGNYIFIFTEISIACDLLFCSFFDTFVVVSVLLVMVIFLLSSLVDVCVLIYHIDFFTDPMQAYVGVPDVLKSVCV